MIKIRDLLKNSKEMLKSHNNDEREARLLLAYAMEIKPDEIVRYSEVSDDVYKRFEDALNKRISGIPYAYITGHKEFMKLDFKVNENVLIPRPETEIIVEEALKTKAKKVLDLCTGSGCIAISIASYNSESCVTGADISECAINLAIENATINNVKVKFIKSDLFENIDDKYDLIVSNPPYIKTKVIDKLDTEVKKEPKIALDGGEDGLVFYNRIAKEARNYLNEDGCLIFEIGFDQGQDVKMILENNSYKNCK